MNCRYEDEGVFETENEEYVFLSQTEPNEGFPQKDHYPFIQANNPRLTFNLPQKLHRRAFSQNPTQEQPPTIDQQHFSKNFQSGNLHSVTLLPDGTYRLKVTMDCHSRRQSQWFYFSCRGLKRARFKITGFVKPTSLYNQGMKVCVNENGAWVRAGESISYGKDQQGDGYCLNFSYRFRNPNTKTLFAYCFPYTYTDLKHLLQDFEKRHLLYLSVSSLTTSILQNPIPLLTISSPSVPPSPPQKPIILLSARVHPGQSVSSHLMQGFLQALLSSSQLSHLLRQHFTFKIIPMINPDGVITGNYRLSYSGSDLNRKWKRTDRRLHKEVFDFKKEVVKWNQEHKIRMVIDMHGHSRRKGVFFYGCEVPGQQGRVREFPYIMSNVHHSYCYHNCNFTMHRSKQGTQRVALHHLLKLPYVYTLQTSFCGDQSSQNNYSITDLNQIGGKLVEGMFMYLAKQITLKMKISNLPDLQECLTNRSALIDQMYADKSLLEVGMYEDSGSESAPSEGCYREDQLKQLLKFDKNFQKLEEGCPKQKIRMRVISTTQGVNKLTHRRHLTTTEISKAQCKFRIINGSIFDKKMRNKSFARQSSKCSKYLFEKDKHQKQESPILTEKYAMKLKRTYKNVGKVTKCKRVQYYVDKISQMNRSDIAGIAAENLGMLRIQQIQLSNKPETPTLLPSRKTSFQHKFNETFQLPRGIDNIKQQSKYDLNTSSKKESRAFKIQTYINNFS